MHYWKYIFLLFGIIFLAGVTHAQDTTVLILREINIQDSRLENFTIGEKIESVPAGKMEETEYGNLTELLTKYSGLNVRSYGVSGLSTASVRGTGSNHTAILWEGINLQSPTNGGLDLTLVPVSFVDEIALQYGGAGSLFGSGTLGGAIHMGTSPKKMKNGFGGRLLQQVGSFGSTYTGLNIHLKQGRLRTSIRGFRNYAKNDFNYYNRFTVRNEEQRNAGIDQQGLLSEVYISLGQSDQLSFKYWYQDNHVQIPKPASAGQESEAVQSDDFHRMVVKYENKINDRLFRAQTAVVSHNLKYDDGFDRISNSSSKSWISEFETSYKLHKNLWIDAGLNNTYEQAEVDGYGDTQPSRNRTAVFLSSKVLVMDRLEVAVSIRESYDDHEFSPFLPSLGLNYPLSRDIQLKSKMARSFRIPTFNDLYWKSAGGAGNPELQPELGWSTEAGLLFDKQYNRSVLSAEVTAFSNHISQWIQWVPVQSAVWTPINVEEVWARGLELTGKYKSDISDDWGFQMWTNYSYTRSTKEAISEGGSHEELHKQVIYTPIHQWKMTFDLPYKKLNFNYGQFFIGEQYIKGDNTQTLDSYSVSEISLSYSHSIASKHRVTVLGKVNNMWDKQYEVRNARPMPGRNYHLSITYNFN